MRLRSALASSSTLSLVGRWVPWSAASVLFLAGAASAQVGPPEASPGAGTAPAVQEVVVTAQKREQRLQDVPVTITAISGDTLTKQGITDATQLQYTAPELTFTSGPEPAYAIRGIGTQAFSRSASSDVAVVVDGVTQGQPLPPTNSLFDVQRVEVLSGPQGMLFGKNASSGVINIVTAAPDPHAFSASAHADVGERGYQVYQGVANIPVTADSALRLSVFSNGEDSTLHNVYTDSPVNAFTDVGGRARFLYKSDKFTLNVIGDYEKDDGGVPEWTSRQASTLAPILASCGVTPSHVNTDVCLDGPASREIESYGLSTQIDVPLGRYTFTSITADRQFASSQGEDSDTVNLDYLDLNHEIEGDNQFSQEFRLTSPAHSRFEYVAGLYFYDFDYHLHQEQAGTAGLLPFNLDLDDIKQHVNEFSYAAFGQGTLHVYKGLNLIIGARETRDITKANTDYQCDAAAGACIPGLTPLGTTSDRAAYSNFSYRAGLQYEFDRNNMVYATYTRGYKGPAINTPYGGGSGSTTNTVVKPEFPLYTEVGYKAQLLDHRLELQIAAFHDIVKDFQAQVYETQAIPATFVFANASNLKSDGVEVDVNTHPLAGLTVGGGFVFNHAVYGPFLVQCTAYLQCGTYNVQGRQLADAPKWTATLNAEYDHRITDALNGYVNANISFRGETNTGGVPDPNLNIPSHAIVNGRLGVRFDDGKYGVAIFARNLFDNRFVSVIFPDPVSQGLNYDQAYAQDSFRVVGASLDARF